MPAIQAFQDDVTTAQEALARRKSVRAKFFSTIPVDTSLAEENAKLRNDLLAERVENAKLRDEISALRKAVGIPSEPDISPDTKIRDIQAAVCGVFTVSYCDLVSDRRNACLVKPRHIAIFISRQFTKQSLPQIGHAFNRDHSTVVHSVRSMTPVWTLVSDQVGGKNLRDVIKILSDAYDAHYKPIRQAYADRQREAYKAKSMGEAHGSYTFDQARVLD